MSETIIKPVTIPFVTVWDYFEQHTFGMAQYFRGLQGDKNVLVFQQSIYAAKLGRGMPPFLDAILRQIFAVKNRVLLKQVLDKPWLLGGQQFVHLIPKEYLKTATVVVFDLINLDYPDTVAIGYSYDTQKAKLEYLKYAKQIITISHFSKHRIIAHFNIDPNRITVVPIGVDMEVFHSVSRQQKERIRERLGIPASAFVILYIGSEQRRKNLLTLAKSLARLTKSGVDFLFVKVGQPQSSVDSMQFRRFMEESGLVKKSVFVDYAENLVDWYTIADIFTFPSVEEGFGIPLLEAMACGLPIVTTKLSSILEVVGDVAATVDDPYDPNEWAGICAELICSPERCEEMGKRGQARAARFSWDVFRKEFIETMYRTHLVLDES